MNHQFSSARVSQYHAVTPTVGIPKGLMFFEHGQLWEDFFKRLECRVVFSGRTTKEILEAGIERCSNETCLPVKVFTGHAASLSGKSDYVFVPRYSSVCRHEMACPKFCALPDEVRASLKNNIRRIEVAIDFDKGERKTRESLTKLAHTLGKDEAEVMNAFSAAVKAELTADSQNAPHLCTDEVPVIAVLGHPYMIYDKLLSMNLIDKLQAAGYRVLTPYDVERSVRRLNADPFLGRNFYQTGRDILGSARVFLSMTELVGMVYLTPFACGVDSLVTEFIERRLRNGRWVPFLKITIDEHSGEAGFDTRLEAFLDMLPRAGAAG